MEVSQKAIQAEQKRKMLEHLEGLEKRINKQDEIIKSLLKEFEKISKPKKLKKVVDNG